MSRVSILDDARLVTDMVSVSFKDELTPTHRYNARCLQAAAGSNVYQFSTLHCQTRQSPTFNLQRDGHAPEFLVFLFKYLMSLVVGITCAVWICSGTFMPMKYSPTSTCRQDRNKLAQFLCARRVATPARAHARATMSAACL